MRAMGVLYAAGRVTPEQWADFLSLLTWKEGHAALKLPKTLSDNKYVPFARDMLTKVATTMLKKHDQFIEETTQLVASHRHEATTLGRAVNDALFQGARWLRPEDLPDSRVFSSRPDAQSLIIGYLRDSGEPVAYNGDASLSPTTVTQAWRPLPLPAPARPNPRSFPTC